MPTTATISNLKIGDTIYEINDHWAAHGIATTNTLGGFLANDENYESTSKDAEYAISAGYTDLSNTRTYGIQLDPDGRAFINVPWKQYNPPSGQNAGLIKTINDPHNTPVPTDISTEYYTENRTYGLQCDQNGLAWINVPWTSDPKPTLQDLLGTAPIGSPTNPVYFDGTSVVPSIFTLDIPRTNNTNFGIVKLSNIINETLEIDETLPTIYHHFILDNINPSNSNHIVPTSSIPVPSNNLNRFYGIQTDKDGLAFVNVPWTNTDRTYTAGDGITMPNNNIKVKMVSETPSTLASSTNGTISGTSKLYSVVIDKNSKLSVKVPWTNTIYTIAGYQGNANLGLIQLGYTSTGLRYAVEKDDNTNQLFVTVPWTQGTGYEVNVRQRFYTNIEPQMADYE